MNRYRPSRPSSRILAIAGFLALAMCIVGAWFDQAAFCAAWLVAWWTCAGVVLGSQANLWLHSLAGGRWNMPIKPHLGRAAARIFPLSVLLVPVLVSMPALYPWAAPHWVATGDQPSFKTAWLSYGFVVARLAVYVAVWNLLIGALWRPAKMAPGIKVSPPLRATSNFSTAFASHLRTHGPGRAALGLIVYGYTATLAGIDLIMSLSPDWSSSGFGLVIIMAQMKTGLAWAVLWGAKAATPGLRRDLGNLLLMYVLMWAYLAFTQFQIIWAENLPREIVWYMPRLQDAWRWLGVTLVVAGFFVPLILLLFRPLKENARCLQGIAALLCIMGILESVWLVLPSIHTPAIAMIWMTPAAMLGMAAVLCSGSMAPSPRIAASDQRGKTDAETVR